MDERILELIRAFSRSQIGQAGARYTPGVHPDAPNIAIEALTTALDHLTCGAEAQRHCLQGASAIQGSWERARPAFASSSHVDGAIARLVALLANATARLRAGEPNVREDVLASLKEISEATEAEVHRLEILVREAAERARATDQRAAARAAAVSTQTSSHRDYLLSAREFARQVSELHRHFQEAPGVLLANRLCLLSGQWGTGKTHFLCDFTKSRVDKGRLTLLVLAKSFQGGGSIASALAKSVGVGLGLGVEDLLDHLDQFGVQAKERVLLVIDGVNEGHRRPWQEALAELVPLVIARKHVALVISCRTPFEPHAIPASVLTQMSTIVHQGFTEQEFDAQAEFFHYYKVPLPEVPLLDDEFSRPLTLKLICEAFRGLGTKKLKDGFHGVASGQKGMTFVLEAFVKRIAEQIEERYSLPRRACWELLKGRRNISDPRSAGFAGHMAVTLREYVSWRAAHRIARAHFPNMSAKRRHLLLEDMRVNGLLDEDYIWTLVNGRAVSKPVLRLPYQRFSDHLIARHLLEKYLDKSSEDALRESFTGTRPLGRVFGRKRYSSYEYARPGWAEALIVEFPESVKRIASENRELYFYLPKRRRSLNTYYKPFVQGLFWRAPTSFSRGTDRIVGTLLEHASENPWREILDAMVAVSIKPGHPYSAKRLYSYLSKQSMAKRDRTWTEYLRERYSSPSVVRLLAWVRRAATIKVPPGAANDLIVILSLVLTTVARRDRDIATRALVELGEGHPSALFAHVIRALSFNDPYVSERMLAAAYGVAMSKHASKNGARVRRALLPFARSLYQRMFAPTGRNATHHTLSRDYALGIIRLASEVHGDLLTEEERVHLEAPFGHIPAKFPEAEAIPNAIVEEVERSIHMDFGNYTIGRLIPNRHNYDHENVEYKRVRRQIEWRIWDLGYRKADFEEIDRRIASSSYHAEQREGEKVDRYGKKYGWIAYFEMYGLREARGQLSSDRLYERTSDCDIDPSFPKRPPAWELPLPDQFGPATARPEDWVRGGFTPNFQQLLQVDKINGLPGPWVLLQGFVQRQDRPADREIFTFLRGVLVRRKDVEKMQHHFSEIEYPGNMSIPDGPADYYLFAGEVGTSRRFAPDLRTADGAYRRYVQEAFGRTERVPEPDDAQKRARRRVVILRLPRSIAAPESIGTSDPSNDEKIIEITAPPFGRWRRIRGVRLELPYRRYSWESYHSAMNDFSGFLVPAASIIDKLRLRTWNREVEFRESDGRAATLYREHESKAWDGDTHALLYIRKDCLDRYLAKTRQTLIWCNWGERRFAEKGDWHLEPSPERSAIFQTHEHIHRRFHVYGR